MHPELIRKPYELEKELAQRILGSSLAERSRVVDETNDDLFSRIIWHSGFHGTSSQVAQHLHSRLSLFDSLVAPECDRLEIGCGTGQLAMAWFHGRALGVTNVFVIIRKER